MDPTGINAAERAAFANGQQTRQDEIDWLYAALESVRDILNSNSKYKAREARLYLNQILDGTNRPSVQTGRSTTEKKP